MSEIGGASTAGAVSSVASVQVTGGSWGRRRPSDRRLRCSPLLGAKAWNADAASEGGLSAPAHCRTRCEG